MYRHKPVASPHSPLAAESQTRPDVAFKVKFPSPGLYEVWGQFLQQKDKVVTALFVINVR